MLPENPRWVEIDTSDGDSSRWPPKSKTERNPDQLGNVDYMLPLDIDHGLSNKWRIQIGQALAEMLGYPEKGMRPVVVSVKEGLNTWY